MPRTDNGKHYELLANEPLMTEAGRKVSCVCLEEAWGSAKSCIELAQSEMASTLWERGTQFIIQEDGLIVAISVHGAMLWLDNVPDPRYFYPPKNRKPQEPEVANS